VCLLWKQPAADFQVPVAPSLLPRPRDLHGVFRIDQVIDVFSILGNGELNTLDEAGELIASLAIVR